MAPAAARNTICKLTTGCRYLSYSRIDRILLVALFARRRGQHLAQGEDLRIA